MQPGLGICLQNKHRTPIYFTKKALRIIIGVHPRSPSEPLFCQLKFLNCENIFKYLVGRLMYRVYHEELTTLQFLYIKNSDIHMHDHYHIPLCRTIQMLVISYSLEIQRQRSIIIYFIRNYTKLYVAYYCVITVAPLHPLHPC